MTAWWIAAYVGLGGVLGTLVNLVTHRLLSSPRNSWLLSCWVAAVVTGALFAELAWRVSARLELLPYGLLAAVCVPLASLDWTEHRLPNVLVMPLYPALLVLFGMIAAGRLDGTSFVRAVLGLATLGVFHLLLALMPGGGMGGGDVKLAGVLGIAAGWSSWATVVGTVVVAFVAAAIGTSIRRACQPRRAREVVAFGPWLIAGFFTALALTG